MPTISLIGAHGTGKTTIIDEIKKRHPKYHYLSECVRYLMPRLGYRDAWQIVNEHGAALFELMNINAWSVIDPQQNPLIKPEMTLVIDRSPVDCVGYYYGFRSTKEDFAAENLVKKLATHYASLTDAFVYFPVGVIPLKGDELRPPDIMTQCITDTGIKRALAELRIPESKLHYLQSTSVDERVEEVLKVIEACK